MMPRLHGEVIRMWTEIIHDRAMLVEIEYYRVKRASERSVSIDGTYPVLQKKTSAFDIFKAEKTIHFDVKIIVSVPLDAFDILMGERHLRIMAAEGAVEFKAGGNVTGFPLIDP